MKPELNPCAHCGQEAHFGEVQEEGSENDGGEFIECTNPMCGMSTLLMFPAMDEVKTLLAERWNARAENVPVSQPESPRVGCTGLVLRLPERFPKIVIDDKRLL